MNGYSHFVYACELHLNDVSARENIFNQVRTRCPRLISITWWDMGKGGRLGMLYASASTELTSRYDVASDDIEGLGRALGCVKWADDRGRHTWEKDGGNLTVIVDEDPAVEEHGRATHSRLPSKSYGFHQVAIQAPNESALKKRKLDSPTNRPYPLAIIQQIAAAIKMHKNPRKELSVSGYGGWDEKGREDMRELVSAGGKSGVHI